MANLLVDLIWKGKINNYYLTQIIVLLNNKEIKKKISSLQSSINQKYKRNWLYFVQHI